jgi:hypothetical protein
LSNLYAKFDDDVRATIGSRLRASDEDAAQFWSALANQGWVHDSAPYQEVGYSFRAAGGLIAEIRGAGDYLDWYCSGPTETIAPWISEALAKKGWSPAKYSHSEVSIQFEWSADYSPEKSG